MRLAARAAALAATTLALAGPMAGADAQGRHWTNLKTIDGGTIQACKVAASHGPWQIKVRVDAKHAATRVNGSAYISKGTSTIHQWYSGWIAKGHISSVGTVELRRGSQYGFGASINVKGAGSGGTWRPSELNNC
jgi:hypothetical protein